MKHYISRALTALSGAFVLTAALALTACADPLTDRAGSSPTSSGATTVTIVIGGEAQPDSSGSQRTIQPYWNSSDATTYDLRVYDTNTGAEIPELAEIGIDPLVTYQIEMTLTGNGPWDFQAIAYDDTHAVIASGWRYAFSLSSANIYCSVPLTYLQTSGGEGTLNINLNYYDLPVESAAVAFTLRPYADGTMTEGTAIDLSTFSRIDEPGYTTISEILLPSGNYRLRAQFDFDGKTWVIGEIDPLIRVCDGKITSVSSTYDYGSYVNEPTMTFKIESPVNAASITQGRLMVGVWKAADYFAYDSGSYDILYERILAKPVGFGFTDLAVDGTGSVTILDPLTGDPLELVKGTAYIARLLVPSTSRYDSYANALAVTRPEYIVPDNGDHFEMIEFTKTGLGTITCDPSQYTYEFMSFVVTNSGAGDGKTPENPIAFNEALAQGAGHVVVYLLSDITSSATYSVASTQILEIVGPSDGSARIVPASALSSSLFTVTDGAGLILTTAEIDRGPSGSSMSPTVRVLPGGEFTMKSGAAIRNAVLAQGAGGAIAMEGGVATLEYSELTNNSAPMGGAVALVPTGGYSASLYINNGVTIKGNASAAGNGGGVYVGSDGAVSVDFDTYYLDTAVLMELNTASSGEGGGFYVDANGQLSAPYRWLIADMTYGLTRLLTGNTALNAETNNYAIHGAYYDNSGSAFALFVSESGTGNGLIDSEPIAFKKVKSLGLQLRLTGNINLLDSIIVDTPLNIISEAGPYRMVPGVLPAFDVESGGVLQLENVIVGYTSNNVGSDSLITVEGSGTATLLAGAVLENNENAGTGGGGVTLLGGSMTLAGGTIRSCRSINGGAVSIPGPGSFTLSSGTIVTSVAQSNGGGIYVGMDGSFQMDEGTISGCTATRGGGIYLVAGAGSVTINSGTVTSNTASIEGGGGYAEFNSFFNDYSGGSAINGNSPDQLFVAGP